MPALYLAEVLLSFGGVTLAASAWLRTNWDFFRSQKHLTSLKSYFCLSLSFQMSMAFLGLIYSLCFYFQVGEVFQHILSMSLGILGILYFFKIKERLAPLSLKVSFPKSWGERALFGVIGLLILNYFYRTGISWFDQDEITLYGSSAKYIANGWNFKELFELNNTDGFPKFAEVLHAKLYAIFQDLIGVRLFKFVSFIFTGLALGFILQFIGASSSLVLMGIALFFGTPELGYLATSAKVDATMMTLELHAFFLLILSFYKKNKFEAANLRENAFPLLLACVLGFAAVSIRLSAAYATTIMSVVALYSFWQQPNRVRLIFTFFIAALIYAHPYLFNYYYFYNPLYPLDWPLGGAYYLSIGELQETLNLPINIPFPFYQMILLLYVGLGLETRIYDFLSFLPHAESRGNSLGWGNLCVLVIFLLPFYWKKHPLIKWMGGMFLILFTIWTLGLQYTRVFHATFSLTIIIAIVIATLLKGATKKIYTALLVGGIIFTLAYQTAYSYKKYPHSVTSLLSSDARIAANFKIYEFYNSNQPELPLFDLPIVEVTKLRNTLQSLKRPMILSLNIRSFGLHTFFPTSLFFTGSLEDPRQPTYKAQFIPLREPARFNQRDLAVADFICIFSKNLAQFTEGQKNYIQNQFSHLLFQSNDSKYRLDCKDKVQSL